jgi:hypothetical protein
VLVLAGLRGQRVAEVAARLILPRAQLMKYDVNSACSEQLSRTVCHRGDSRMFDLPFR